MILLINTSDAICHLTTVSGDEYKDYEWQADRGLAKGLLRYIESTLASDNKTWQDISAIGVFRGPGSFTGLRIGLTVANTIANAQGIPIVGGCGPDWQHDVINDLEHGKNDKMILPFYIAEANITSPKK